MDLVEGLLLLLVGLSFLPPQPPIDQSEGGVLTPQDQTGALNDAHEHINRGDGLTYI